MRRSVFIKYALSYTLVLLLLFSGVTFYMIHTSQRQVQEDIVTGQVNRLNRIHAQHRRGNRPVAAYRAVPVR